MTDPQAPGEPEALADDTALARLAVEVTSSLRLAEVLDTVTSGLVRSLGADAAYLWLESATPGGPLELAARAGLAPPAGGAPEALARLGRPDEHLCTNEVAHDGSSGSPEWLVAHGIRAVAGYPLVFRGERLGVLAIYSSRRLTDVAFKRLFLFAQQASVALANARLFAEVSSLRDRLSEENAYLRAAGEAESEELVGESPAMREVLRLVAQVAPTESSVLLEGETGTGKEVVARAIHRGSRRAARTLVKLNCGAISPSLIESELFGHERGAFTGATTTRVGRFELADGGTLFLDEIGELPLDLQPKLLRALQEQEIEKVGGNRTRRVDVRVIAATNRTLADEVRAGRFRADLYYRLAVFPILLPPLRERAGDVPRLAESALARAGRRLRRNLEGFTAASLERLARYSWPGNVRELLNVVERAAILSSSGLVEIPSALLSAGGEVVDERSQLATLAEAERRHLQSVLDRTGWRIEGPGGAAEVLGLRPSTLRSRMAKHRLRRTPF
ncbi:MAG: sigma 54-interacting transcriptional regulator [Thermoanaerobaculia bacterium]